MRSTAHLWTLMSPPDSRPNVCHPCSVYYGSFWLLPTNCAVIEGFSPTTTGRKQQPGSNWLFIKLHHHPSKSQRHLLSSCVKTRSSTPGHIDTSLRLGGSCITVCIRSRERLPTLIVSFAASASSKLYNRIIKLIG